MGADRRTAEGFLLDVPGVLLRLTPTPLERFAYAAATRGLTFPSARLAAALVVADRWWGNPSRRRPGTALREWEDWVCYVGLALQELGIDPEEVIVEEVAAKVRADRWLTPAPGAEQSLIAVAQRGPVGVLSNALPSTREALDRHGLLQPLTCCLFSAERGRQLPDAAEYVFGAATLGLSAMQVTYVTAEASLALGARKVGMQALLVHGVQALAETLGVDTAP